MELICALIGLVCALYLWGCMPPARRRAAAFVGSGSWEEQCVGASFTACTGQLRRVLRFPEGRSYSFRLSGHLQQGRVEIRLLDDRRTQVLSLTGEAPSGIVTVERGRRYRLCVRFENASGDYQLEWA